MWVGLVISLGCLHFVKSKFNIVGNDLNDCNVGLRRAFILELLRERLQGLGCGTYDDLNILQVLLGDSSGWVGQDELFDLGFGVCEKSLDGISVFFSSDTFQCRWCGFPILHDKDSSLHVFQEFFDSNQVLLHSGSSCHGSRFG